MEDVLRAGLPVDAVEDASVVPDVVDRQEFRRVQEAAGTAYIERQEVSEGGSSKSQGGASRIRAKRSPTGIEAAECFGGSQSGPRGGIHHQAGLVAVLSVGRPGNQFHALQSVQRNLSRKKLALLIAHRLAVNHEGGLRVIAQRMKEPIGVGRHGAGTVSDCVTQAYAGTKYRELRESARIHVLM